MPKLKITRGAMLRTHGQATLKPITYDDSNKTQTQTTYYAPNVALTGSDTFIANNGPSVFMTIASHPDPSYAYNIAASSSFSIHYSHSDGTTCDADLGGESRTVEFNIITGFDSGNNPIYQHIVESVTDLVLTYRTKAQGAYSTSVIAKGGYVIVDNQDRTERYILYNWDDSTYGNPNRKLYLGASNVQKKSDGRWQVSIGTEAMDNVNGTARFLNTNKVLLYSDVTSIMSISSNSTQATLTASNVGS
jgi:hypothetical protein